MVCFMLMDGRNDSHMRVEMDDADAVSDICDVVSGCWCDERFVLRNGYIILEKDSLIGDCISDGDTIDVVYDPLEYLYPL